VGEKDQNGLDERASSFLPQPSGGGDSAREEIATAPWGADALATEHGQVGTLSPSDSVTDEVEKEGGPLPMPIVTLSRLRQSDIDAMSFEELDSFFDAGVQTLVLSRADIIRARKTMVPVIWRVHDALSCQGSRTDLLDAPDGLTFDAWIKSKVNLGSRATIYRLLKEAGLTPPKQFVEGARVKVRGKGEAGIVTHAHDTDGGVLKYNVLFEGEKKAVTVPAENLVKVCVRKVCVGDLIRVEDMGTEYRYEGRGKFVLTKKACAARKRAE
jgi:hypothetical protein